MKGKAWQPWEKKKLLTFNGSGKTLKQVTVAMVDKGARYEPTEKELTRVKNQLLQQGIKLN